MPNNMSGQSTTKKDSGFRKKYLDTQAENVRLRAQVEALEAELSGARQLIQSQAAEILDKFNVIADMQISNNALSEECKILGTRLRNLKSAAGTPVNENESNKREKQAQARLKAGTISASGELCVQSRSFDVTVFGEGSFDELRKAANDMDEIWLIASEIGSFRLRGKMKSCREFETKLKTFAHLLELKDYLTRRDYG